MTDIVAASLKSDSFWSRAWRFMRDLDEALHETEASRLAVRVERLEHELGELKTRGSNAHVHSTR